MTSTAAAPVASFSEQIMALLPATARELRTALPISASTFYKLLARLRAEARIHIGRWMRTLGDYAAVYVAGEGRDARRPRPRTHAQASAKYLQSLKNAGLYEDYLADGRQRHARWRRKHGHGRKIRTLDPLMAAFYNLEAT